MSAAGSRLPIALNLTQSSLPPSSAVPADTTPVQHLTAQALKADYDLVCVPLANDLWRERWERLCLRAPDDGDDEEGEGGDVFAGGAGNANAASGTKEWVERERSRFETAREAEAWRTNGGFKRSELNITRLEETERTIALASSWLELDSEDEGIRFDSELALRQELALALHLSIPTLIIPPPLPENRAHLPSYARAIASLLEMGGEGAQTRISIRIGISDRPPTATVPSSSAYGGGGQGNNSMASLSAPSNSGGRTSSYDYSSAVSTQQLSSVEEKRHKRKSSMGIGLRNSSYSTTQNGGAMTTTQQQQHRHSLLSGTSAGNVAGDYHSWSWEVWDCIRNVCGYHRRLSLTLDMTNPLPSSLTSLNRWLAEPTQFIFLPSQAFIPNAKGYPVLSKACQTFVRGFVRLKPTIILSETNANKHPAGGPQAYIQYVRHIEHSAHSNPASVPTTNANGAATKCLEISQYADWLQAPLQPLMDDLGSATYEVFERDPVKYRLYEEAVCQALMDRPEQGVTVICVVGAGRGPLVTGTIRAAERASRKVRIYAVEKNANAFVTLQEKQALEWGGAVKILFGDMRQIDVPELADIMVSELLGSFGDNELSPECLDGAGRFLKPEGISIPASYTAHLAPLSSSKLHCEVQDYATKKNKNQEIATETPYVVMFQQATILSGTPAGPGRCGPKIQECWSFEHPRRDMILDSRGVPFTNSHNTRAAQLTFRIPTAGTLHGLAGYFEAHLYGNVGLSIHPERMNMISPDMMSWFPLFFPLKEPLYLPSGAELDVHIWRLTDPKSKKVWYEWHAESFLSFNGSVSHQTGNGYTPSSAGSISGGRVVSHASNASGGMPMYSPMMDAPNSPLPLSAGLGHASGGGDHRIKIGQTALHNPGGRSSWIGL
ncbi:hypothetical protein QFC24_003461 [Naganishia onofrii]|uniref:Uncharacterized protein n=1 Tax=Naganishia onofrii TaxID=1851511 RepID=A0ACC2XJX2_9TREE|nr:hypothetical protein QFC24_003461 [Naganishia onofrii]